MTLSRADLAYVLQILEQDTIHDLSLISQAVQMNPRDLLNQVAIAMADQFLSGARDFHACDAVMNLLFGDIVNLGMDAEMPEPAFSIYLAFDSGEHRHTGDDEEVVPWEKWTRPELVQILDRLAGGLSGARR